MKICLISNEYPPETSFGGIGTYTYNLAHGLVKLGNEVSVITKAVGREKIYRDIGVKVYRVFDKKVPFRGLTGISNIITGRGFSYYWHSRSVFLKIEEIIKKEGRFDIIEGPLWDGECFAYSPQIGIPLVVRLQTPIFKSREILGKKQNKVIEFIEKKSLQKATLIASISKNIGEVVSRHYKIPKDKILLAYLGIKLPDIADPIFKKNSFKLLYIGRLEKRKGTAEFIDSLPKILEKNAKITIDIVGKDCYQAPGSSSYLKYFKIKVPQKFWSRVKFHGFVSNKKLKNFYKNCDIFVAPSRYESFGLIFLEAMAYGKPVIGTKIGGIPEVVIDGKVGILIDVNNPNQIADAVIKVFSDEDLREKMGKNAYNYTRKNFTVESMVDLSFSIYKKAILKFHE